MAADCVRLVVSCLWLDVEVQDAALVDVVERLHNLLDEAAALLLCEAVLTIRYLGKQLPALHNRYIEWN